MLSRVPAARAGQADLRRGVVPFAAARGDGDKAVAHRVAGMEDQGQPNGADAEGLAVRRIDAFKEVGDVLSLFFDLPEKDDLEMGRVQRPPRDPGGTWAVPSWRSCP